MTSDLSIDEELVLHSIGWEPVELVSGIVDALGPRWACGTGARGRSATPRPPTPGRSPPPSNASTRPCTHAGGHGVVGVHVEWAVERHHIDVALVGTAVRPVGATGLGTDPVFVSDLSGRDFTLLRIGRLGAARSGRRGQLRLRPAPVDGGRHAAVGPERGAHQLHRGHVRRPRGGHGADADGGPRTWAGPAWSRSRSPRARWSSPATPWASPPTAPWSGSCADGHRNLGAQMVLPLDDPVVGFDAASLRGG